MSSGEQTSAAMAPIAIRVRDLRKSFVPSVPVLDGVHLDIPHSEVTALVGANGSGKSTLVKILSGYYAADAGSHIEVVGQPVAGQITPELMRRGGVRFVHQDLALATGLTVMDNVSLGGFYTSRVGRIRWRRQREQLRDQLARWHILARPDDLLSGLPRATLAKLAVLRAVQLIGDERLSALILDEPTAALAKDDAGEVLTWIRLLAAREKVGVLFISHRLDEILNASDTVAVLRNGKIAAHESSADLTHDDLVSHIVGAPIQNFYPSRPADEGRVTTLAVRGLTGGTVRDASFALHRGEITGVTGLPGSGYDEIPYLLMDPQRKATGQCELSGVRLDLRHDSISERVRRGMALIPADRKRAAVVPDLSMRENMTLPRLGSFYRRGLLSRRAESRDTQALASTFHVTPPDPDMPVSRLSGGNQQKVVLAKWFSTEPDVLIVHEPTEAVDVGAKAEIFALIARAAQQGTAVLVASVEYEDLAHLCDKVLIIGRGQLSATLDGPALTAEQITAAAFVASVTGAASEQPGSPPSLPHPNVSGQPARASQD
jgi:ribose transport system ATP-binding protein